MDKRHSKHHEEKKMTHKEMEHSKKSHHKKSGSTALKAKIARG